MKLLLAELQHLIDHRLTSGNLFMILCGSYMGFMEKEVLGSKSPLFGRRTEYTAKRQRGEITTIASF